MTKLLRGGVRPRHLAPIPTRVLALVVILGSVLLVWRLVCWTGRHTLALVRAIYWPTPRPPVQLPPPQ